MVGALDWSGNQRLNCCFGAAHWIYDPLSRDEAIGSSRIHFIERGYHTSVLDMQDVTAVPTEDVFLGILRECPPEPWCS